MNNLEQYPLFEHGVEFGVEFDWIGEGYSGEFSDEDPDDAPLIRFTVMQIGEDGWEPIEDGSYCTAMHADKFTHKQLLPVINQIISVAEDLSSYIQIGSGYRRRFEELSWLDNLDVERIDKGLEIE